jgi:hypothetical protein
LGVVLTLMPVLFSRFNDVVAVLAGRPPEEPQPPVGTIAATARMKRLVRFIGPTDLLTRAGRKAVVLVPGEQPSNLDYARLGGGDGSIVSEAHMARSIFSTCLRSCALTGSSPIRARRVLVSTSRALMASLA